MFVLLSWTQAGPGRTVKQEQEEISRNHVQTFLCLSVQWSAVTVTPLGIGKSISITDCHSIRRVPLQFQGANIRIILKCTVSVDPFNTLTRYMTFHFNINLQETKTEEDEARQERREQ